MTTLLEPRITRIDSKRPGAGRQYRLEWPDRDSLLVPSVTTVLDVISKPALYQWYANQALESVKETLLDGENWGDDWGTSEWIERIVTKAKARPKQVKDDAADFGTRAHLACERVITSGEDIIPDDDTAPCVEGFLKWRDEHGIVVDHSERMLYSLKHGFAGTADIIGARAAKRVVVDIKTSSGLWGEYALQLGAYALAYEEMTGERVHEAWALRLPKKAPQKPTDAPFEAKRVADLAAAKAGFLAALSLYNALKQPAWKEEAR